MHAFGTGSGSWSVFIPALCSAIVSLVHTSFARAGSLGTARSLALFTMGYVECTGGDSRSTWKKIPRLMRAIELGSCPVCINNWYHQYHLGAWVLGTLPLVCWALSIACVSWFLHKVPMHPRGTHAARDLYQTCTLWPAYWTLYRGKPNLPNGRRPGLEKTPQKLGCRNSFGILSIAWIF